MPIVLGDILSGERQSDETATWWNVVTRDGQTHTVVPTPKGDAKIEALLAAKRVWGPQ